jgi:hypothetical protein
LAVVVLVVVMLCTGASSTPRQWKFTLIAVSVLGLVNVFVLPVLESETASSDRSGHAATLLLVAGALLIPVAS